MVDWFKIRNNFIQLTIGSKDAFVFGNRVTNDVTPKIVNSRTMLPLRFIAENLGATVLWQQDIPDIITITKDDVKIVITIGSNYASVNGKLIKLDSPAFIENNRTYTPVRFVAEELGATVKWIPETQQIVIMK